MCLIQHVYFIGSLSRHVLSLGVHASTSNLYQRHASCVTKLLHLETWWNGHSRKYTTCCFIHICFILNIADQFILLSLTTGILNELHPVMNPDWCVDAQKRHLQSLTVQIKSCRYTQITVYAIQICLNSHHFCKSASIQFDWTEFS